MRHDFPSFVVRKPTSTVAAPATLVKVAARRPIVEKPRQAGARVVQIIALIKPFQAAAVLEALGAFEILGGTVREAMGYGRQKERLHRYLGSEYNTSFLPKVELTLFLRDEDAQALVKTIVTHARTGRMGDGKIMVLPCLGEYVAW
jgi:nitrogen regulatory protein PII